jgi:hypothetical protein
VNGVRTIGVSIFRFHVPLLAHGPIYLTFYQLLFPTECPYDSECHSHDLRFYFTAFYRLRTYLSCSCFICSLSVRRISTNMSTINTCRSVTDGPFNRFGRKPIVHFVDRKNQLVTLKSFGNLSCMSLGEPLHSTRTPH